MRILKYALTILGTTELMLPADAKPLHVGGQHGELMLWVLVPPGDPVKRTFTVYGTGHEGVTGNYIGTAVTEHGTFVWHVFEQRTVMDQILDTVVG